MHRFLFAITFLGALAAPAQQPTQPASPQGSNWQHVQALPIGANIAVKARASHASCKLKSVDADTLTCTHGKDLIFQRTEVLSIKIPHRGRSTLIGLAAGAGVGAIIGAAATHGDTCSQICILSSADVALATGIAGGAAGAVVGVTTDFSHSTVYKAP